MKRPTARNTRLAALPCLLLIALGAAGQFADPLGPGPGADPIGPIQVGRITFGGGSVTTGASGVQAPPALPSRAPAPGGDLVYMRRGDRTVRSDGVVYQKTGGIIFGSDGSQYFRRGDAFFGSEKSATLVGQLLVLDSEGALYRKAGGLLLRTGGPARPASVRD